MSIAAYFAWTMLAADPAASALEESARQSNSASMIVLKEGKTLASYRPSGRGHVQSVTKICTSLAAGLLLREGKLKSIDAKLGELAPDFAQDPKGVVTLRQLLSHSSGVQDGKDAAGRNLPDFRNAKDFLGYARRMQMQEPPGTKYRYNNVGILLAAYALEQVAGEPLELYLRRNLFEVLGIRKVDWYRDRTRRIPFFFGMQLSGEDLAKIGQLMLGEGRWEGRELLSADWVRTSTGTIANPALSGRMALVWFVERDPASGELIQFNHTGDGGSILIVFPKERAVAVRIREMQDREDSLPDFAERAIRLIRSAK